MQTVMLRLLIAGLVTLLCIVAAEAHAFLSQAVPPVGGAVSGSPPEIRITFTEAIEPAFSRIELTTADGQPIRAGPAVVDPRNSTQLVLTLPRLGPGRYRVR